MLEIPITNEEVFEFEFEDFSVIYNVTQGIWSIYYYIEEEEVEEIIASEDDIPQKSGLEKEDFLKLKEYVRKVLDN